MQIRSERRICRGAHAARFQTFSYLQAQQRRVPVQFIGFRDKRRSARIYKANAVHHKAFKTARYSTGPLLRRHLLTHKVRCRNGTGQGNCNQPLDKTWFPDQLEKSSLEPSHCQEFLGFQFNTKKI